MAGSIAAMDEPTVYQSLYRRYRPQRFDEVLGQDHVTQALRNAVRDGRVGHAYLFSGPRGTGKTSTARILAKVLNCHAPDDGEPCGSCERCRVVERGQDIDWLLEQDAASKSKVDDMRDLLDRVPLGTSGNRKIIILDEVHMLSQGAENALLKTLEEPPSHVVFVLATTDPQRVRPTIRSRTQHFEFHLLSADMLAEHVRHIIADAGLPLADEAISDAVGHVVQVGAGSVRDTLSALDQVAALGKVVIDSEPVGAILEAVAARDAGRALVAVGDAIANGREPRALGEALIVRLREAFLTLMGAGDDTLVAAEREQARVLAERMGAAGLTRALEVLGEALTELVRKPDPRVVLEVALVRLTRPDADRTLDALLDRIEHLERAVGAGPGAGPAGDPQDRTGRRSGGKKSPGDPSGSGGGGATPSAAARAALASNTSPDPAERESSPSGRAAARPAKARLPGPDAPKPDAKQTADAKASPAAAPELGALRAAWEDTVLAGLPIPVRSKWRGGQWLKVGQGTATFAVPNQWHKDACDGRRADVEQALADHLGAPVTIEVVVEPTGPAAQGGRAPSPSREDGGVEPVGDTSNDATDDAANDATNDAVDPTEVADLADAEVATGGVDLLVREFGGELITSDAPEAER